jgi:hypothetical protein
MAQESRRERQKSGAAARIMNKKQRAGTMHVPALVCLISGANLSHVRHQ